MPGEVIAVPVPSALPAPVPQPPHRASGVQPPDVFIAYSRKDLETCKHVVAALRSEGLEVFFDQYIEGGEEWREIIASNIKSCSVFMVLFSANSLKSPQVRKEVNHATDNSRSIVPLMIENVKLDGGLALELNGINFIPYFENPQQRLPEAVEKARNLAAIAVFDRRRDYQQAALGNSFVPMRSDVPVLHPSGSSPASWRRGVLALLGALLLASAGAALLAVATGRDGPVWVASIATALFFAALPYVIGVMMLFGRLVRS